MKFDITRAAHAEIRVTDLKAAEEFYVDALGLIKTGEDNRRLYLGGLAERDLYSLALRKDHSPGLSHMAFRVSRESNLRKMGLLCDKNHLSYNWVRRDASETGQHQAIRFQDPSGLPIEIYCGMDQREWLLQRYDLYRGAHIMRLDHFNVQIPDVEKVLPWWKDELGFQISEYTVTDPPGPERPWAVWLHRKQNVHDIAIMNGLGPRFHHVGMWVPERDNISHLCDILAAKGMANLIERGPGRHGLSNAYFVYLRDPDGNRIELYTGDYLIPDPDWEPKKWYLNDSQRATFWGSPPPKSWFEEASLVENIKTGEFMPTSEPVLAGSPTFVH